MFLTCAHVEFLWFFSRQTLQNIVDTIDIVLPKSNSPDSTAANNSLIDIFMALDALVFVEEVATRRCRELGRDGRSTLIMQRPLDGLFCLSYTLLVVFHVDCLQLVRS